MYSDKYYKLQRLQNEIIELRDEKGEYQDKLIQLAKQKQKPSRTFWLKTGGFWCFIAFLSLLVPVYTISNGLPMNIILILSTFSGACTVFGGHKYYWNWYKHSLKKIRDEIVKYNTKMQELKKRIKLVNSEIEKLQDEYMQLSNAPEVYDYEVDNKNKEAINISVVKNSKNQQYKNEEKEV